MARLSNTRRVPNRRPSPQPIWPGFLLTIGLLFLLTAAGAVGWMYFGPGFASASSGDTSVETTQGSAPDTGIAACQAIIDGKNSEELLPPADVLAGLKSSADSNLQTAGQNLEQVAALTGEEQLAALEAIPETIEQIATGCAAVGVPLPADMLPQTTG